MTDGNQNTNKHDVLDDPRLTAFALGELDGPGSSADRAAVEAILAKSAAARDFVNEIRQSAGVLTSAYAGLPLGAAALDPAQREAIRATASAEPVSAPAASGLAASKTVLQVSRWRIPATLAAAAVVAVVFASNREMRDRPGTSSTERMQSMRDLGYISGESGAHGGAYVSPTGGTHGPGYVRGVDPLDSELATANYEDGVPDSITDGGYTMGGGGSGGGARTSGSPASGGGYRGGAYRGPGGEVPRASSDPSAPRAKAPDLVGGRSINGGRPGGVPLGPSAASGVHGFGDRLGDGAAPEETKVQSGPRRGEVPPMTRTKVQYVTALSLDVPLAGGRDSTSSPDVRLEFKKSEGLEFTEEQAKTVRDELAARAAVRRGGDGLWLWEGGEDVVAEGFIPGSTPGSEIVQLKNGTFVEVDARGAIRTVEAPTPSREGYDAITDNPFIKVADAALSTFGADVDSASYSNVRRMLRAGQLPPADAVRIEELVNYFPYNYAPPTDGEAFAAHVDVTGCPWDMSHRLVRIGIKGKDVARAERPASNLVFLLDVSGSMSPENRLPLVLRAMRLLTEQLEARDKVSIVVYAGSSGLVLPPTGGDRKDEILAALNRLQAGGSTNGGQGIELAYKTASESFIEGGINRVILATDGDFNVGVTDDGSLVRLIEEKAKAKVFLSVLGVGEGNLQDAKMEKLADKGNGNYAYLDSDREAKKVLVDQVAGTLQTIAKDLKLQVEFNPLRVASYRLIGYENRVMAAQDFADDKKDSGDVGAGHTVTAMYEVVPATTTAQTPTETLRYQQGPQPSSAANSGELLTVKIRWKTAEGDTSTLRERPVMDEVTSYAQASPDFKFAASVAAFGMILRNSPYKGQATLGAVEELAGEGLAFDPNGYRAEFLELVRLTKAMKR